MMGLVSLYKRKRSKCVLSLSAAERGKATFKPERGLSLDAKSANTLILITWENTFISKYS